jgi:hypothetical protein
MVAHAIDEDVAAGGKMVGPFLERPTGNPDRAARRAG